jgi:hypothetical protein
MQVITLIIQLYDMAYIIIRHIKHTHTHMIHTNEPYVMTGENRHMRTMTQVQPLLKESCNDADGVSKITDNFYGII